MALYRNVRYGTERDRARGTSRASLIGSSTVVSPACKRGGDTGFETAASAPVPKVLISPHAGYIYSGRVAAAGYRWLALVRERITRAVLLGPSHFVGFHGLAAASAGGWQTRWAACRSTGTLPNGFASHRPRLPPVRESRQSVTARAGRHGLSALEPGRASDSRPRQRVRNRCNRHAARSAPSGPERTQQFRNRCLPHACARGRRRSKTLSDLRGLYLGHDHVLCRTGHFDTAPCRRPARDGVRSAERFIDADRMEMCGLAMGHVNERQKEAEALPACVGSEDQSDRHHFAKTGVLGEDFTGLKLLLERP